MMVSQQTNGTTFKDTFPSSRSAGLVINSQSKWINRFLGIASEPLQVHPWLSFEWFYL